MARRRRGRAGRERRLRSAAPIALACVAAASAVAVLLYSGFTLDDSYIGYRFAEQIAAGNGFVYNVGERELGTTTPLFILTLALFKRLGVDTALASHVIGVLSFAGTAVLSRRIALNLGVRPSIAFLLGLGVCGFPPLLKDAVSGMETAPYSFLCLLVLCLYLERRFKAFVVAGAVVGLVRPDGMLVLVACGLYDLLLAGGRVKDWALRALGVVALCSPWFLFCLFYFGRLLPNSGFAKLLQAEDWGLFGTAFLAHLHYLAPVVLLIAVALVRRPDDRRTWLPAMYVLAYVGFFSAMRFPGCPWYLGPVHAPLLILAAAGAEAVLGGLAHAKTAAAGALAAVALFQASRFPQDVRQFKKDQVWVEEHHGKVGRWLGANTAPGVSVAADNIGYIGYFSGRRILDVTGLIQSEILEGIRRTGNKRYAMETHKPEYIAVQNRGSSPKYTPPAEWFAANGYRVVFEAPYGPGKAYYVWSRVDR